MNTINKIFFSPTKTTSKILDSIIKGIGITSINKTDLTPLKIDYTFNKNALTIVGVPVYSGRVPQIALDRLSNLKGDNSPVIIVAVYGNRHFDDALVELKDYLEEKGFIIISAGAFIGEHSFSDKKYPIAVNRPDKDDLNKAYNFGKIIKQKLGNLQNITKSINVPGNRPYKVKTAGDIFAPVVDNSICTSCLKCFEACPTGAISKIDPTNSVAEKCIKCAACVKVCTPGARSFKNDYILGVKEKLFTNFSCRKEPEVF